MTKRVFAVLVIIILALATSASVGAQEATPPKLISAKSIQDIAKVDTPIRYLALSPDGTKIAWIDNEGKQICLLTIADAASECSPFAENFGNIGGYSSLAWSPDGRYIATNETFFDRFVDSDIWVFDTTTGLFTDRTDDGYFGNALKLPKNAYVDYLPTWNPVTNDLYMFRTPSKGDRPDSSQTNLYQLPVDKGDPTLLQELGTRLPPLSVYRPVSISPDGKQMAFLVLPSDYLKNSLTGVWVMNLEDKSFKQITGLDALQGGQPKQAAERKEFLLIPNNIGWAGNDALVVSSREAQMFGFIPQNIYYVDIATSKATPLIDFSDIQQQSDYIKVPSNGELAPKAKSPQAGIVIPDGKGYIYLSTDIEPTKAYVWWKALPPTDEKPTLIGTIEDFKITPAADAEPAISRDGKQAVLFGYLLTIGS